MGNVIIQQSVGMHGERTCNRDGLKLIHYVLYNKLKIINTLFDVRIAVNMHGRPGIRSLLEIMHM
jgi:hypothetical protein